MARVTFGDIEDEDYSIERKAYVTYVHLNHRTEDVIEVGYCIDGVGCFWTDTVDEMREVYDVEDIVYYYRNQLQE